MPRFNFTANHPSIYTKTVGFKLSLEDYLKLKKLVKKLSEERWKKEKKKFTMADFLRNLVKEVLKNEKI
jgi:hypothetical protein